MATTLVNQDGTLTVTLTARERAALERSATQEGKTFDVFVDRQVNHLVNGFQRYWREQDATARQAAYDAAAANVRSQVDTLLGI